MYLAELVEVAIGLVVVYFLTSLASSQILEWLAQFLKWRSRDLETAIRGMILNEEIEPRMFSGTPQRLRGFAEWVRRGFKQLDADERVQAALKQAHQATWQAEAVVKQARQAAFKLQTVGGLGTPPEAQRAQRDAEKASQKAKQAREDSRLAQAEVFLKQLYAQTVAALRTPEAERAQRDAEKAAQQARQARQDARQAQAQVFLKQLYAHPLIAQLASRGGKPTYIPTRAFALALFDIVMSAGTEASRIQGALTTVRNKVSDPKVLDQLDNLVKQATTVMEQNERILLESLRQELLKFKAAHPDLQPQIDELLHHDPQADKNALTQFKYALPGLAANNLDLKRTLESLVSDVALRVEKREATIADARTNVETWFDTAMGQLTDLYKRRSKLWAAVIAFALAVILNVDTLVIANTLWREPTLRQAIVANAERLQPPPTPAPVTALTTTSAISPTQTVSATQTVTPTVTVAELERQLQGLQLPIGGWELRQVNVSQDQCVFALNAYDGWRILRSDGRCQALILKDRQDGWRGIAVKLFGWLITALAAAQGAPFWFDLLNKLLQMRGAQEQPKEKPAAA